MIKEQKIVNKTKQSEFKQNKFYIIIIQFFIKDPDPDL